MNSFDYRGLVWDATVRFTQLRKCGVLVPQPCVVCGRLDTHGHHTDYRLPDQVVWLCGTCHRHAHKGVLQFLGSETVYRHGGKVQQVQKDGTGLRQDWTKQKTGPVA